MKTKTGRTAAELCLALLFSAAVMLMLCESSPLHAGNNWCDTNCYITVARGIIAGKVPYRDLIDHKGPLLYLLHVPAMLISPRGYFGIFLMEVLEYAAFVFTAMRIVRQLRGRNAAMLAAALSIVAVGSAVFEWGDSAEEMCLPLMAWSIYDAIRWLLGDRKQIPARMLLVNGFLAGCVFWIKFSLLGVHFAWMAVIAIESLVREKKLLPAVKMCLLFLAGMAITALPWLVYFGATGALGDLFTVYFVWNTTMYAKGGLAGNLYRAVIRMAAENPVLFGLCALVAIWALVECVRKKSWTHGCLLVMMACSAMTVFGFGRSHGYGAYALAVYAPLAAVPLTALGRRILRVKRTTARRITAAACLCVCVGTCALGEGRAHLKAIGGTNESWPSRIFAKEICKTENPTLLNFDFYDEGFYFAADVIPTEKWFCKLNVNYDAFIAAQRAAVENGAVDYVVTKEKRLEDYGFEALEYEEILREDVYYLYRKTGLDPNDTQPGVS